MPGKKSMIKYKKAHKRIYRKKRSYKKKSSICTVVVKCLGGFADRTYCHLKNSVSSNIIGGVGAGFPNSYGNFNIGANYSDGTSLLTGALGWSQLSRIYAQFVIKASHVKFTLYNESLTAFKAVVIPINAYSTVSNAFGGTVVATPKTYMNMERRKEVVVGTNSSKGSAILYSNANMRKITAQNPTANNFDLCGYTGSSNATSPYSTLTNPVVRYEHMLYMFTCDATNFNAVGGNITLDVEIIWDIEFFNKLPNY